MVVARHRSPSAHGAHRMPPSQGPILETGAGGSHGGSHRSADPANRRNMIVVGGAVALAGQLSFSHVSGTTAPLLPDFGSMAGFEPTESTIIEQSAIVPLTGNYDGLEPVALTADSGALQQADAAKLVKAAGLNEAAGRAQAAPEARMADAPSVRGSKCPPNRAGLAGVKTWVSTAGVELRCIFGVGTVGGLGSRRNVSDHPRGLALDFKMGAVAGDKLAEYALRYQDDLKIKYVIWRQRINYGDGSGWQGMEDRGSPVANHMEHVHVSFRT